MVSMTIVEARPVTAMTRSRALGPGLLLAGTGAATALAISRVLPSVSPLLVAIVLGFAVSNTGRLPVVFRTGLTCASKRLLRVGIVLLGLQLMLADIVRLGAPMLGVIVATVVVGITTTLYVGRRLGVTPMQSLLIACGFSICGAAAVAAVEGVVDAEEEDVATAVALVVVFGTLMIPFIPLAGAFMGLSDAQTGLWAGGSIHEVAQVVAVGGSVGASALALAVVVKLGRVLMLGPVILAISLRQRRAMGADENAKLPPVVPLFVVGFIGMAALRTSGWVSPEVLDGATLLQTAFLAMAMFALGCGVRVATLKKVGGRPVVLAMVSTAVVATTALVGVLLFGAEAALLSTHII